MEERRQEYMREDSGKYITEVLKRERSRNSSEIARLLGDLILFHDKLNQAFSSRYGGIKDRYGYEDKINNRIIELDMKNEIIDWHMKGLIIEYLNSRE